MSLPAVVPHAAQTQINASQLEKGAPLRMTGIDSKGGFPFPSFLNHFSIMTCTKI